MRLKSILACLAISPLLLGAAQPLHLQPSSKWVVDLSDNDTCRLIRLFGEGNDQVKLVFESDVPGDLSMMAIGSVLHTSLDGREVTAEFRPGDHGSFTGKSAHSSSGGDPAAVWEWIRFADAPEAQRARHREFARSAAGAPPSPADSDAGRANEKKREQFAAGVTAMALRVRGSDPIVLSTGPMDGAVKVLDLCTRQIVRDLGLDPDVQDKIARPAWAVNASSVLTGDDYPRSALIAGQETSVKARLVIDERGTVTSCVPLSQFDAPDFQRVTCKAITERAHYEPAELADGTKVASYDLFRVMFRIAG